MLIRARNTFVAFLLATSMLWLAGCKGPCARHFNMTALSYFPPRSALCAPPPTPHFADPNFFGYHGTCWHLWPEGWIDCHCPGLLGTVVEGFVPKEAGPEPLPHNTLPMQSSPTGPVPSNTEPMGAPTNDGEDNAAELRHELPAAGIESETILPAGSPGVFFEP